MENPQARDRESNYQRSPVCPRKGSVLASLLSSVISSRACGKRGHSMNVAIYFRAHLEPLVPVTLPAVRDLREAYLWPPHAETEGLGDNPTKVMEMKNGSMPQAIWSQTHLKYSTPSSRKSSC